MKLAKRLLLIHTAAMALYVGSYLLLLKREPTLYFGRGPQYLDARYVSKWSRIPGAIEIQGMAALVYGPLEWLDRELFPSRWELPPPALVPDPPFIVEV